VTQPPHVPLQDTDRVRPSSLLPPPPAWYADRPAELRQLTQPVGPRLGSTGPDLGYGLKLARRLESRLEVPEGEHREDAVAGCFGCGARRASSFGRAPVIFDMQWAYTLWGFFGGAPADLLAVRADLFRGAAEDYWGQRRVVDAVRPDTLRLTPEQVRGRLGAWKDLLVA
jgi:hypothetical protein